MNRSGKNSNTIQALKTPHDMHIHLSQPHIVGMIYAGSVAGDCPNPSCLEYGYSGKRTGEPLGTTNPPVA